MNTNTKLPVMNLSGVEATSSASKADYTDDFKKGEKDFYEQFKIDQENRVGVSKRTDSPVLTLASLSKAPKGFFSKFDEIAKEVTSDIVSSISSDRKSIVIAKHRKDPTDEAIKEQILYIVMSEFAKVDRTNADVNKLTLIDRDVLLAIVINEIIGFGPLEPLWNDRSVTEIMCNGPKDIQIEVNGLVRKIESIQFRDTDHLSTLIDKLYSSVNKQLSPVNPYERGRLHDNSRIFAIHEVIAPNGPNFNIRKHTEEYWTPQDIIDKGTASPELMEYLGNLIHAGISFLVVGGTGTGKTTLLNSLTGFIPEHDRVITLEENLELKIHPNKLLAAPMECVPAKAGEGVEYGITMRDLVRSSLQMRPDRIIIGEVSDGAAYDLAQALNTGHAGASTVHANDAIDSVNRLRSLVSQEEFVRGPAVLDLIGSAFDIIIVVNRLGDGSRKIVEVVELGRTPILADNKELTLDIIPLWKTTTTRVVDEDGNFRVDAKWEQVNELSKYRQDKHRLNLVENLSWEELLKLSTYNVSPELRGV